MYVPQQVYDPQQGYVPQAAADPLPSWNAGKAKQSICEFVARLTNEGGPDGSVVKAVLASKDADAHTKALQECAAVLVEAKKNLKKLQQYHKRQLHQK